MTNRVPPREFDGYILKRRLGKGGMGEVHLALDTLLDRQVAIKFITSHRADDVARTRFLLEARAFARLQHPNVVSIYRVGEVEGMPYLVSEWVKGYSLDTMAGRTLSNAEIVNIAAGLSRGLAAAHKQGVIHRDIKPGNVMIAENGDPKLLDFGIAKLLEAISAGSSTQIPLKELERYDAETIMPIPATETGADETTRPHSSSNPDVFHDLLGNTPLWDKDLTRTGTAVGTPRYMAPEIWRGREATFRSDIYSFGALIYFIASGVPPHTGKTAAEIGETCVTRDAKPLLATVPRIHPGLAMVVDNCLQRDPARRYANGNELRLAIAQLTPEMRTDFSPEGNPYRGLSPFEEEHTNLFFGRDSEIRLILDRLRTEPMVVVVGDSGVGKSSLCRAGVIPRIPRWLGDQRKWTTVTLTPGHHPVVALSAVLSPIIHKPEQDIENAIRLEPASVARMLRSAFGPDGGVVIFIDQLEELITQSGKDESTAIAELLQWFSIPTPGVRMLATVRGDFLSTVAAMPQLSEQISKSLFFLRPMTAERIREAIVGPAAVKSTHFESPGLVDLLVHSTEEAEGGLPLLQFTLRELWEVRDGNLISAKSLEALGGVTGALSRHADNVFNTLPISIRDISREILLQLVTARRTRARKTDRELNPDNEEPIRRALDSLVSGRLVVVREAEGGRCYEIAHESLLEGWSTLASWLSTNADQEYARERLRLAAHDWKRLGYTRDALWSARRLREVSDINPALLNESSRRFLAASRKAVRNARIARIVLLLIAPIAGIAIYTSGHLHTSARQEETLQREWNKARSILQRIDEQQEEATALRNEAHTLFARPDPKAAEQKWAEVRDMESPFKDWFARASAHLETAILIAPDGTEARRFYAEVLFRRALLAEERHEYNQMNEFLQRLTLYDDGTYTEKWNHSGELTLQIIPDVQDRPIQTRLSRFRVSSDAAFPLEDIGTDIRNDAHLKLPPGSYLATIQTDAHPPIRYPFRITRNSVEHIRIQLPPPSSIPPDMIYIPEGTFLFGSDEPDDLRRDYLQTAPIQIRSTDAYLISQRETTFGQWLTFVEDMPLPEQETYLPRVTESGFQGSLSLNRQRNDSGVDNWTLQIQPQDRTFVAAIGESIRYPGRTETIPQDWLRFPVTGITASEATDYARWLAATNRMPGARLCTELEWERAARGADSRRFPHGNGLLPSDANYAETHGHHTGSAGPDEVGSWPASKSPFGIEDMAGNAFEWTQSTLEDGYVLRGGGYASGRHSLRMDRRTLTDPAFRDASVGFRICADPVSP